MVSSSSRLDLVDAIQVRLSDHQAMAAMFAVVCEHARRGGGASDVVALYEGLEAAARRIGVECQQLRDDVGKLVESRARSGSGART